MKQIYEKLPSSEAVLGTLDAYGQRFINMIFRIIEQPLYYQDILRFVDFTLLQYDYNGKKYDYDELNKMFKNVNVLVKSEKTLLHFICYATNIPNEIFILLSEE